MSNLEIVTVANDFDCLKRTINKNKFMSNHNITVFDNRKDNVGISKRYNSYIQDKISSNKVKDSWVIFCHQDFGFLEDPLKILNKLDKNFIYGPTGVKKRFKIDFRVKRLLPIKYKRTAFGAIKQGFHSSKYFSLNIKDYFKNNNVIKFPWTKEELVRVDDELFFISKKQIQPETPVVVDSLDCCCLIVHSSVIKKYDLKFDEKLDFHLYSEDFSFNAKYNHNVLTKVIQFDCFHRGAGTWNIAFDQGLDYIKDKYKGKRFVGTCFNCDW